MSRKRATARVEAKVKAATAATSAVGLVLAVLTWVQDHPESLPMLPRWAQGVILLVVPPLVTFASGWLARHTPRGGR